MKCAPSAGVLAAIAAWAAWSQPPAHPEFDVASLKPVVLDGADTYMANLGTYRNGVLTQTNTTLAECLRFACEITSDDLLSGPDWIKNKNVRFDILAKTAPGTPRVQALLMLRTLLEDRFKLVLRREPRVLSYYALTAPNGEQGTQHEKGLGARRGGRGLGQDIEAHHLVLDPVGPRHKIVGGEVVGEAEALGEGGIGEGDDAVAVGSQVGVVEVGAVQDHRFQRRHVELRAGRAGLAPCRPRGSSDQHGGT